MRLVKIALVCIALSGCNQGEREIVVVPSNYIGRVMIVFDQKNGMEPLYNDGKRVYNIPQNGILKTKFSPNPGWIGTPDFYYDKISPNKMLQYEADPRALPVATVVAYGVIAGSTSDKNNIIRFLEYYVGNKAQIDSAYEKAPGLDIIKLIR